MPLAYLITFRTYGTWLHGDPRGSMDRQRANTWAEPNLDAIPGLAAWERTVLKHPARFLDATDRGVVERAIGDLVSRRHATSSKGRTLPKDDRRPRHREQ